MTPRLQKLYTQRQDILLQQEQIAASPDKELREGAMRLSGMYLQQLDAEIAELEIVYTPLYSAMELWERAMEGGRRLDYGLYWALNKMAEKGVEGRAKKCMWEGVGTCTTYLTYISHRDGDFILDKIQYSCDHYARVSLDRWWRNWVKEEYELYHVLGEGKGGVHVRIGRGLRNGNRQLVVTHFQNHVSNMNDREW